MRDWRILILGILTLCGCGGGGTTGVVPVPAPASVPAPSPAASGTTDWTAMGFQRTDNHGAGYEIAYVGDVGQDFHGFLHIYIDQPPNPIDAEAFAAYQNPGFVTNTPRFALFTYAKTIGSPSAPPGPLTSYTDPYGYTWGEIARTQNANYPFNPADYPDPQPASAWEAATVTTFVPPGVVQYNSINKNQALVYSALDPDTGQPILRFFVTDQFGNTYLMKAQNLANDTPEKQKASFDAAVLPPGWTKTAAYLPADLEVNPVYGGASNAMFQSFRDSADNSYDEIAWGASGDSVAQQIGYPMPIWAGHGGTRVNGTAADDLLFGGPGDDTFYPSSGNDSIDGGDGFNTVVLIGFRSQHAIISTGEIVTVTGPDGTKTLTRVQSLRFDN